ncbi:MAG: PfkB family carbohydrate kinase, partial [Acidiferrobacter sp.]
AEGSEIHADGHVYHIPPVRADKVCDPTGCGDAYRAGLLFGLEKGFDWETSGRVASLLGSLKIEYNGTQNHTIDAEAFGERFAKVFGYRLN